MPASRNNKPEQIYCKHVQQQTATEDRRCQSVTTTNQKRLLLARTVAKHKTQGEKNNIIFPESNSMCEFSNLTTYRILFGYTKRE